MVMARVQMMMPDTDKYSFVHQARREGMSLSAWLRAAARERLERSRRPEFKSEEECGILKRWRRQALG